VSLRPLALGVGENLWIREGPDVVWEGVAGEGPVFDPASGETHFLNDLPVLLLLAIDNRPVSCSTLMARFAGPMQLDEQGQAQILAALVYLEGAELVESLPPSN